MAAQLAFITGIGGFAGSWLAEELLAHGYRVAGSMYGNESTANISAIESQLELVELDILDEKRCLRIIKSIQPNHVFHLAAFASVGRSFEMERLTYQINFEGSLNILSAVRDLKSLKKFVMVGSADCYGLFKPKNKLLTEDQPFNPTSPYAVAKVAAEHAGLYYYRRYKVPVLTARPFNHTGPRQDPNFVVPSFARRIARIESGRDKPVMEVGDLSVKRDLSDVRDITRGYRLLAEKGQVGKAYNLCCGRAVAIKTVLNRLLKMSTSNIRVRQDKSLFRSNDIPCLRGSYARAKRELGFEPIHKLDETLSETLNYWRDKLSSS